MLPHSQQHQHQYQQPAQYPAPGVGAGIHAFAPPQHASSYHASGAGIPQAGHAPAPQAGPSSYAAAPAPAAVSAAPVPPRPTPAQALRTTLPSRLRAGTSGLMQALPHAPDLADGIPVFGSGIVDDDDEAILGLGSTRGKMGTPVGAVPKLASGTASAGMSGRGSPAIGEGETSLRKYLGMPVPPHRLAAREAQRSLHKYYSDYDLEEAAEQGECLIPVRIELETDTHRIRDVFCWNMRETLITPKEFAHMLLVDMELPLEPFTAQIETAINQACDDARAAGIGHTDFSPDNEDDVRVIVEYTVQILRSTVKDRFEWDLCSGLTPESFAQQLCADLGLSGEAVGIISHAIREQLLVHRRAALELLRSNELDSRGARPLEEVWRDLEQAREFGPLMEPLTEEELEKIEMDAMRNSRRNRRAARAEGGRRRR
ncbi:Chromatin structure remodeling complex protein sfh1 [Tilletia horrida]|uniref:Chromatin structure remodeling complex protein sfh1 n=1 Tax=Tilletia horrida TaxID=155126 RepID=A0AAN6JIL9_9BASI|nr:Chromatin structure remodeling complex protein sfh1 [Tilletia horrida]